MTPSSSEGTGPVEAAQAEAIIDKNRQDTWPGRLRALEEMQVRQLEMQSRQLEIQTQQLELQRRTTAEHFESTREACDFALKQVREMFSVGNAAVAASYEALDRSRQAAEILNRQPPPRTTSGENATEFGKHIVSVLGGLAEKLLAGDPLARLRVQALAHQMLGVQPNSDPQQAQESAAVPASTQAAAATNHPDIKVGDALAMIRLIPESQVEALAQELGLPTADVPLRLLFPLAEKAMREAGASSAAS